jgi:bacteriocin biosynthesis cyclodehydratase domain-containing protein
MKLELPPVRLRALPMQVISGEGCLILKRGRVELAIRGEAAATVVCVLLGAAAEGKATREDLAGLFGPALRAATEALLEHLVRRRFLVPVGEGELPEASEEGPAEVFYWHFGQTEAEVTARMNGRRVVVVGVNAVSRRLVASLRDSGLRSVELRDDPLLRNLSISDPGEVLGADAIDPQAVDCLVATADLGGPQLLSRWNEFCVLHRRPFLPVVLMDLVGQIGPLTIPGETACLECARQRQRSHAADPHSRRLIEAVIGRSTTGFLPPMASMLGDVAAMEIIKFLGIGPPVGQVGALIEINMLACDMTARPVLRLPRCPVCTPLAERPSLTVVRDGGAP